MLQQTTVAAVIPFWNRFMVLFPDVQALAMAHEAEILAAWSGLGYYRRARNLHKAARIVMEDLDGVLPSSRQQWLALPGVGAYASGAIASIGLGEVVPAVDANVRRVLSRWFFDDPREAAQPTPRQWEMMAREVLDPRCPGQWNEAVMELGAVLCRADKANCLQCPVMDHCLAGLAGVASEIPQAKKAAPATAIAMALIAVHKNDQVLLLPPGFPGRVLLPGQWELGRQDTTGLHQGLWSLPSTPWYLDSPGINKALDEPGFVRDWIQDQLACPDCVIGEDVIVPGAVFFHSITRYRLKVRVWDIYLGNCNLPKDQRFLWESTATPSRDGWKGMSESGQFVQLSPKLPISKLISKAFQPQRPRNV